MAEEDLIPKPGPFKTPEELPLLILTDAVCFPGAMIPLVVGSQELQTAVEESLRSNNKLIALATDKKKELSPEEKETINLENLYTIGSMAQILQMMRFPGGKMRLLIQGISRIRIKDLLQQEPFPKVRIEMIPPVPVEMSSEVEALSRTVKSRIDKMISLGEEIPPTVGMFLQNIDRIDILSDIIAGNLLLKPEEAQKILETLDPIERLKAINVHLGKEMEIMELQKKIQEDTQKELSESQKKYMLREQLKTIQKELGEADAHQVELDGFKEKIEKSGMTEEAKKVANRELERFGMMSGESAEATVIRNYLNWLTELPWNAATEDNLDIHRARQILDEDHYDLEKIKERILEYLAVRKLKKDSKGPILCFYGPPGTGKTSIGQSIARALGRKFYRLSLGGTRDEAEIRGFRRTYIGAVPGRVIQGIHTAGTKNPVFMLDEIDKIGADFRGDPSAALLEVLDPEQNKAFSDHYLEVPFDLSEVLFIATANNMETVHPTLRDRLEVLELFGYTLEEKTQIAKKYLIPKQLEAHGITLDNVEITDGAIQGIIEGYTREAGLRNLNREIANVCRKVAKEVASDKKEKITATAENLNTFLGVKRFLMEAEAKKDMVGVATGLAWTEAGGDILFVEANKMKGKGDITLTGLLGDVMKESAIAALTYARSNAQKLGIDEEMFGNTDVHIHVPAGAIPKDGPSAGITMAVSLISALKGVPVRHNIAMTGEITLRGRVLPIGGLKEKALAARRAGIKKIIIPAENQKDLPDIPENLRKDLEFIPVSEVDEVIALTLAEGKGEEKPKGTRKKKG